MKLLILRRTVGAILTLVLACLFAFVILYVIPGDATYVLAGVDAPPEVVSKIRVELGLDDPIGHRFIRWLTDAFRGDFGLSVKYRKPVVELLGPPLIVNVRLALWSLGVAMVIAFPLGVVAAIHHDRLIDRILNAVAQITLSLPTFWIGMLLIALFSTKFNWLPVASPDTSWRNQIMPIISLSIPMTGFLLRTIRTRLVEVMSGTHVEIAHAKGLSKWDITTHHGLRNAAVPIFTAIGLVFANVLTGSMIAEMVFGLPGMARILIGAVQYRDTPLVMGGVVLITLVIVILHLILDMLTIVIDPRVRRRMQ